LSAEDAERGGRSYAVILFTKDDCTQGDKKKELRPGIGGFAKRPRTTTQLHPPRRMAMATTAFQK
jgi:hypothetical protein